MLLAAIQMAGCLQIVTEPESGGLDDARMLVLSLRGLDA